MAVSIDEQAQEDLESKLSLESEISTLLLPFFESISDDVEETGSFSDKRFSELQSILLNSYKKTSDIFSMNLVERLKTGRATSLGRSVQQAADNIGISYFQMLDNIQRESQIVINQMLNSRSFDHAGFILNTTEKRISEAKNKLIEEEAEESMINESVAILLDSQINGRIEAISSTEVQQVSELSKIQEGRDLNSTLISSGVIISIRKMWKDMDDNRVRPWHKEADGQIKFLGQPFFVKNEFLMNPGDRSMGASLNNVIHCRCSSIILL